MTHKAASFTVQHAAVRKWRDSLESLKITGQALLSLPSLEDTQAAAFQNLTENALYEAGHEDDITKVEGVVEPTSTVELIMQDIIEPHLMTAEMIEGQLAEKAAEEVESDAVVTGDIMTSREATMEGLRNDHQELVSFGGGMAALKEMISMEGITADIIRPMVIHHFKHVPDICERLGISLEEMGETQVLGDMTDAVDRIAQTVDKAREFVETKVSEIRAANGELTSAGEAEDFTGNIINAAREGSAVGPVLDEDVNVSSTTDAGAVDQPDTTTGEQDLDGGEVTDEEPLDTLEEPDSEEQEEEQEEEEPELDPLDEEEEEQEEEEEEDPAPKDDEEEEEEEQEQELDPLEEDDK